VAGDDLAFHQRLQLGLGDLCLGPRVDLGDVLDLPAGGHRTGDHGPDELGDQLPLHHVSQPNGDACLDTRRLRTDVTRRQERGQQPVDIASAPFSALDGTLTDGQQAGQVALARAIRPDDERDSLTEAQPELVEGQHAHTSQRRYPHAPSLGSSPPR